MKSPSILIVLIILFLSSCSSDVSFQFPTDFVKENTVIINDKFDLKDYVSENNYSSIITKGGEVSISINGQITNINTTKGGLINLNKEKFVIFPIYYGKSKFIAYPGSPRPILIDSVLYFNKEITRNSDDDLVKQAKEFTDMPFDPLKNKELELSVAKESDLFIEKIWHLDITDEIPEKLEVKVERNEDAIFQDDDNVRTWRTTIMPTDFFVFYCMMSEDFESRDLRKSSVENTIE